MDRFTILHLPGFRIPQVPLLAFVHSHLSEHFVECCADQCDVMGMSDRKRGGLNSNLHSVIIDLGPVVSPDLVYFTGVVGVIKWVRLCVRMCEQKAGVGCPGPLAGRTGWNVIK